MALTTKSITRSGRIVDLEAPRVEDICIGDVAWQLAHEVRWNGCLGTLSVAQHSFEVHALLSSDMSTTFFHGVTASPV